MHNTFYKAAKPAIKTAFSRAAGFGAKYSHDIMTRSYLVSNLINVFGKCMVDAYERGEILTVDWQTLNPLQNWLTAAGYIGLAGAIINRYQKTFPIAFNITGLATVAKTGAILNYGWGKPGQNLDIAGNLPSLMIGILMLTDRRFLKNKTQLANSGDLNSEPHPAEKPAKRLGRRFYMGAYLMTGYIPAIASSVLKRDPILTLYWATQLLGGIGMILDDDKLNQMLKTFGDKQKSKIDLTPEPKQA